MTDFFAAIAVAFGVVFVAELGDKTQLLALGFGARYRLRTVAIGLFLGYGAANAIATVAGGLLGAALPERTIQVIGGGVFLGFAVATLLRAGRRGVTDGDGDDADRGAGVQPAQRTAPRSTAAVISTVALAIAMAEMGDKTQIATATLASQSAPVGVWIGATAGAAASGMVGAVAGGVVGHRVAPRTLQLASAALFGVFGVAMLAGWF